MAFGSISAASFTAAKPSIVNGSYSGGANLPGSFVATHPYVPPAPAAAPAPSSGGGGTGGGGSNVIPSSGGGGGYVQSGPTAQQIAAQQAAAAAAAQAAKIDQARTSGQDSQLQTGLASGSAYGANYQGQAGQLYGQLAQGENTIDQARKNIGIHQIQSIRDLMHTIHQGLAGTNVHLANNNALDSSAAGAAARAYADYGNVETNKVNNGAETANSDQDVAQKNLDIQRDVGMSGLKSFRDNAIASITSEAQKGLDGLKQYISMIGGDGNSVEVQSIKQQILDNAQGKLATVDGYIQDKVGGVHATDRATIGQQAYAASNAGVIPSGPNLPFQLDNPQAAPQVQQGGANTSLIPQFTLRPRQLTQ